MPDQDIRIHMSKFKNGYSARGLDTKVTTVFFKKYFQKFANKETAFLTKATRADLIWNFNEGAKLPFRSKELVTPFLQVIDKIQKRSIDLSNCMVYIMAKLIILSQEQKIVFDDTIENADFSDIININTVINMLEDHFASRNSSRLPVIAIYSSYKELFKTIKRYDDKSLKLLNVHTSSDKHGYGDIEIWNNDDTPFEMVEIKHNISIDRNLIFDIAKKTENTTVQRYYVLTTYRGSFANIDEEKFINKFILKLKKDRNIEIIPNGIIYSLKYYLRFIEDYNDFIKTYTEELIIDAKNSTEVKDFHIKGWLKILKEHHVDEIR
jgi:DNA (cytosine-5)-methyltransferase 1